MTDMKKSVEEDSSLINNLIGYYSGDQQNSTLRNFIEARTRRRSGLFSEGRVLYERGGLSFDDLSEETHVDVEEACYSITKQGG